MWEAIQRFSDSYINTTITICPNNFGQWSVLVLNVWDETVREKGRPLYLRKELPRESEKWNTIEWEKYFIEMYNIIWDQYHNKIKKLLNL